VSQQTDVPKGFACCGWFSGAEKPGDAADPGDAANSGDDADPGDAAELGALLLLNCGAASADTMINNNSRICKLENLNISKKAQEGRGGNVNWIGLEKKAEREQWPT
jgi:hypothetical protein